MSDDDGGIRYWQELGQQQGKEMEMSEIKTGLALLREPFPAHQISKLPKGTKAQNECDAKDKVNCSVCGGWHHPRIIHLDYVGHAALTDRLLEADPLWTWEPLAYKEGLPAFDGTGGLWIKLTVCGHTRIGYGHAASSSYKDIGAREKEVIGDALRNAAMRFGAALDLWHKGELHLDEPEEAIKPKTSITPVKAAMQSVQINDEDMVFLRELAANLVEMVEAEGKISSAYDYLEAQKLDNDQTLALWNILQPNSKTRNPLKKEGEERRQTRQPEAA